MDDRHEDVIREVRRNADYQDRIEKLEKLLLGQFEREALSQLFMCGPTWDGDIIAKSGRDMLIERGYATRVNGWSFLTIKGVEVAIALTLDRSKQGRRWLVGDFNPKTAVGGDAKALRGEAASMANGEAGQGQQRFKPPGFA